MTARYIVGDVREVLAGLPDASVDLVLTSPPFLALRSYLPSDHPDKAKELGSEPTPGEFIDTLLDVVEECRRVLAPHGSLCIELGDTYSGSGGAGGDYGEQGLRDGQPKFEGSGRRNRPADVAAGILAPTRRPGPEGRDQIRGWPSDKSLCLVPEMFRFSLAYGFNPLTGRQTERWRVRNVVRWCRPNPPVGALADKFRPATSEMVVACRGRSRYFDLDAVRTEPIPENERTTWNQSGPKQQAWSRDGGVGRERYTHRTCNPAGAPPLDWWKISTEPYPGSHYATWPSELCVRPILAMCPRRVCVVCGAPSRREANVEYVDAPLRPLRTDAARSYGSIDGKRHNDHRETEHTTTGWTTCGCPGADGIRLDGYHTGPGWRPGLVLDPFAGSGTTLAVATGHGRDAIGIDLDGRNADLARQRVGMFLEVEDAPEPRPPLDVEVSEGVL